MKTLKNIGIPGPEPSLYNGNMTELHSKVTAAVLFQLFENFTCMCILFLRCEQDFFSFFVRQGLLNFVDDNTAKYGHVWGYMEGLRPTIVVSDVEMMKEIYIKEFRKFYSRKVSRLLTSQMNDSFFSKRR